MAAPAETDQVPLSEEAQEAKEVMQRELLRSMARKMMAVAVEDERERRIKEMQGQGGQEEEDSVKKNAYEQLMVVQEDLVRTLNLMRVKAEAELEQAQRITKNKKEKVHDELIRKTAGKEADRLAEEERKRRISEGEGNIDRQMTYDRLVHVQEDLLKTIGKMKADEEMKLEQERRIIEGKKLVVQDELIKKVGEKAADSEMDRERSRRTGELSEKEYERRVTIAHKMLDVQKELLATHKPLKPIQGTMSQQVLEDAKAFFQEQLRRKAFQKEAIIAMDKEQQRRISESDSDHKVSDVQAGVLEAISRQGNVKKAKELVDSTQKDYIQAEVKARVQEETVRKVHQKQVDKEMDKEKDSRVAASTGKDPPHISVDVKQEILSHSK